MRAPGGGHGKAPRPAGLAPAPTVAAVGWLVACVLLTLAAGPAAACGAHGMREVLENGAPHKESNPLAQEDVPCAEAQVHSSGASRLLQVLAGTNTNSLGEPTTQQQPWPLGSPGGGGGNSALAAADAASRRLSQRPGARAFDPAGRVTPSGAIRCGTPDMDAATQVSVCGVDGRLCMELLLSLLL